MQRPDGVIIIALGYLLIGLGLAIGALTLLVIPLPAIWLNSVGMERLWAMWGVSIGIGVTAIPASIAFATSWALLALKEWARWLAMALALLMLFAVPFGTIAGALIIWYLLQENVKAAFEPAATLPASLSY